MGAEGRIPRGEQPPHVEGHLLDVGAAARLTRLQQTDPFRVDCCVRPGASNRRVGHGHIITPDGPARSGGRASRLFHRRRGPTSWRLRGFGRSHETCLVNRLLPSYCLGQVHAKGVRKVHQVQRDISQLVPDVG